MKFAFLLQSFDKVYFLLQPQLKKNYFFCMLICWNLRQLHDWSAKSVLFFCDTLTKFATFSWPFTKFVKFFPRSWNLLFLFIYFSQNHWTKFMISVYISLMKFAFFLFVCLFLRSLTKFTIFFHDFLKKFSIFSVTDSQISY